MEIIEFLGGIGLSGLLVGVGLYLWMTRTGQQKDIAHQVLLQKHAAADQQLARLHSELQAERSKVQDLTQSLAATEADYRNLQEKLEEQQAERKRIDQESHNAFRLMASDIFEEQRRLFTAQNKVNLSDLLLPLGEKIERFEQQVQQTGKESLAWNAALKEQVQGLSALNQKMSQETENLTKALKGDNQVQGNWGEFILESILEKSGLRKNHEYSSQVSVQDKAGQRFRPDVIVKLPSEKSIVIDAKTNLVAYERYTRSDAPAEQKAHLQAHINALRAHIKALGQKNYHKLYALPEEQLDFVLMFVPLEPAFSLAVHQDLELFNLAYQNNIIIVSPSTLLATLRTIANTWKNEHQHRNALEIARQGGNLYDKFVAFTEDLQKIGKNLHATQDSYQAAMKKLSDGKGNLVQRTLKIKAMGIRTGKALSPQLVNDNKDKP